MKTLPISLVLLFAASFAHAAPPGLNLSWDDCGAAGALNRDFACDTNEGSHALVGSLVAPPEAETADVLGFESFVRLDFGSTVPDWWQLRNSGACREFGADLNLDFSGMTACTNRWLGQPIGNLGAYQVVDSRVLLNLPTILDASQQDPLTEGAEYYMFRIIINHDNTFGQGVCAGCQDTARIVYYRATIVFPSATLDLESASTRNYVLWQQSSVPVRGTTWAGIKQLYR